MSPLLADQVRIAKEESRRVLALGVPASITFDDLNSEGFLFIAEHPLMQGSELRIAIRRDLIDFMKREKRRGALISDEPIENINIAAEREICLVEIEPLTIREAQVVELMYTEGLTVQETARALHITPRHVDRLISSSKKKFGVRSLKAA